MDEIPAPLLEALTVGAQFSDPNVHDGGVSDLLVDQTEMADVVLLNKIDLVSDEPSTAERVKEVVSALNPRALLIETEFGKVQVEDILAAAKGVGVVDAGIVDDHKDAVHFAETAATEHSHAHDSSNEHDHAHESESRTHSHDHDHANAASDHSHSHEHEAHSHDHDHTNAASDHSHSHDHESHGSHSHSHDHGTDGSHSHSHDHGADGSHSHSHDHESHYAGIGSFVYKARRPFHPGRLLTFLRHMPVVRGLPESNGEPVEEAATISDATQETLKRLLRSKGFVWCADSNIAALYWSHAGTSFELQVSNTFKRSISVPVSP